jgi:hypothetical protein
VDRVALYCELDDFYQAFAPAWPLPLLPAPGRPRRGPSRLSSSEIMRLVIAFHDSDERTFQHFYPKQVCRYGRAEFPHLVRSQRLMECLPSVLLAWSAYLRTRLGPTRGIAFLDSLPLPVCPNRRLDKHRVFHGFAQGGKTSVDWF